MKAQTNAVISREGATFRAQLPSQMKGLLLEEYKKTYVYRDDIPVPELEPGKLLIRVKVAGFCHTDLIVMSVSRLSPSSLHVHCVLRFPVRSDGPVLPEWRKRDSCRLLDVRVDIQRLFPSYPDTKQWVS
jgi:hypothetical protein